MTTANETSSPATATAAAPSANGGPTLRDRVRSLRLAQHAPEGRRTSFAARVLPWGLCVILAGVAAAFGYYAYAIAPSRAPADAKGPGDDAAKDAKPPAATAAGDVASSGDVALTAKGYIIPVHQIQVSPKVAGMLVEIDPRLEEGARFKEGDVLAKIEKLPYEKECQHAERAAAGAKKRTAQARASLASAKAALAGKQDVVERDVQLKSRGQFIADSDLILAEADRDAQAQQVQALAAAVEAAEADEAAAQADLVKAQWNLDNCEIRAPVSGTILKKGAEKGNIVNPVAFNIASSLCDMADLSDLEVDLKIQERDIPQVKKGQVCIAMPEAYQGDPEFLNVHPKGYTGRVSRLMPTADRSQGAIPVRVRLDIPKEEEGVYLKPDMSVIVQFLKGAPPAAATPAGLVAPR
jgi:multidrug resistance efflux pump